MFDLVQELQARVADLERRIENQTRKVRVRSYEGGRVVVEDDTGFVSAPIPQGSITAGAWRFDAPAEPGTQGLLYCDGDPANAVFVPMLPTNDAACASTEPGTARLISPQGHTLTIGAAGWHFVGDVTIDGAVAITGSALTHNGRNVGHDHRHIETMPGPATTGVPQG